MISVASASSCNDKEVLGLYEAKAARLKNSTANRKTTKNATRCQMVIEYKKLSLNAISLAISGFALRFASADSSFCVISSPRYRLCPYGALALA